METFEVTEDVYGIDTGQFGDSFISVYLFDDAEPTLVDSGTESSADTIADRMDDLGVPPEDLENIVLSTPAGRALCSNTHPTPTCISTR
ncbi:MAG: hypothetical protein V5A36_05030 [Natronomonas sp.]